jgi:hypothetical protein
MIWFLMVRGFDENVKALIDEPNVAVLRYNDALKRKSSADMENPVHPISRSGEDCRSTCRWCAGGVSASSRPPRRPSFELFRIRP